MDPLSENHFPLTKKCNCGHFMTRIDTVQYGTEVRAAYYMCSGCRSSELIKQNEIGKNPEGNCKLEVYELDE